jgi:hypothetical protein
MDHMRFDHLARTFAGTSTRRRFSGTLAALGLGSLVSLRVLGADEAEAKKKGKKVTVCHNGQTIKVRKLKLKKHLKHGDTRGACPVQPQQPQQPQCVPNCTGPLGAKECGDDGCGGTCGDCPFLTPVCASVTFTCEPIVP